MICNVKSHENFIIFPYKDKFDNKDKFDIPFLTRDGDFNKYNINADGGITHYNSDNTQSPSINIQSDIQNSLTEVLKTKTNKNDPYIISRTFKHGKSVTTIIVCKGAHIQIDITGITGNTPTIGNQTILK